MRAHSRCAPPARFPHGGDPDHHGCHQREDDEQDFQELAERVRILAAALRAAQSVSRINPIARGAAGIPKHDCHRAACCRHARGRSRGGSRDGFSGPVFYRVICGVWAGEGIKMGTATANGCPSRGRNAVRPGSAIREFSKSPLGKRGSPAIFAPLLTAGKLP